jgi:hypothetical protein
MKYLIIQMSTTLSQKAQPITVILDQIRRQDNLAPDGPGTFQRCNTQEKKKKRI